MRRPSTDLHRNPSPRGTRHRSAGMRRVPRIWQGASMDCLRKRIRARSCPRCQKRDSTALLDRRIDRFPARRTPNRGCSRIHSGSRCRRRACRPRAASPCTPCPTRTAPPSRPVAGKGSLAGKARDTVRSRAGEGRWLPALHRDRSRCRCLRSRRASGTSRNTAGHGPAQECCFWNHTRRPLRRRLLRKPRVRRRASLTTKGACSVGCPDFGPRSHDAGFPRGPLRTEVGRPRQPSCSASAMMMPSGPRT